MSHANYLTWYERATCLMQAWEALTKHQMTAALADTIRDAERRGTPDLRDGEIERAVWAAAFANAYLWNTQVTHKWDELPLEQRIGLARQWAAAHADETVRMMRLVKAAPVESVK